MAAEGRPWLTPPRVVPERSPWLQIIAVFGGFLAGPLAALRVSGALAPESDLVQGLSVLAFELVFAAGALVWLGIGVVSVVLTFCWNVLRGRRPGPASPSPSKRVVPRGYGAFVFLGATIGLGFGLLAGLVSEISLGAAVTAYGLLGLGYGFLLWAAAHHGYLPCDPE